MPSRGRRTANVFAGGFLIVVATSIVYGIWAVLQPPDRVDTAPLVESARQFAANGEATAGEVVVHECTGEGSVPALIERPFETLGDLSELEADLLSQARSLGWVTGEFDRLERANQVLDIVIDPPDRPPRAVWLYVQSDQPC